MFLLIFIFVMFHPQMEQCVSLRWVILHTVRSLFMKFLTTYLVQQFLFESRDARLIKCVILFHRYFLTYFKEQVTDILINVLHYTLINVLQIIRLFLTVVYTFIICVDYIMRRPVKPFNSQSLLASMSRLPKFYSQCLD